MLDCSFKLCTIVNVQNTFQTRPLSQVAVMSGRCSSWGTRQRRVMMGESCAHWHMTLQLATTHPRSRRMLSTPRVTPQLSWIKARRIGHCARQLWCRRSARLFYACTSGVPAMLQSSPKQKVSLLTKAGRSTGKKSRFYKPAFRNATQKKVVCSSFDGASVSRCFENESCFFSSIDAVPQIRQCSMVP